MSFAHANDMDYAFRQGGIELREQVAPCVFEMVLHPNVVMSSMFVRREDLAYYQALGINRFKIGERMYPTPYNVACAKYYTGKMKKLSKRVVDFLFRDRVEKAALEAMDGYYEPFFKGECDGTKYNCHDCGHCMAYAKRVFQIKDDLLQLADENYHKRYFGGYARYLKKLMDTFA